MERQSLFGIVAVFVLAAVAGATPPNFVLFMADDVSFDDFGCQGHPTIRTPNIDALAAGGSRFVNAYLTTSSCSPTRTSIITGRYPHNTGGPELHMLDNPHLANLPQFPCELRNAGYFTALAGKTHFNGDVDASFDVVWGPRFSGASGGDRWIQTLRERPKGQPFFMWFASKDAHRGWDMDVEEGPHGPGDVIVPPYHADTPESRVDLARYYNEVNRFDTMIGDVVKELIDQGVYANTVIFIIADNGRPFPRDKTWLYDSGIRTVFIVHGPALVGPAEPTGLVSVLDIAPTVLELSGVKVPVTMQGVSLVPMLADPTKKVRDFVFAEHNWHGQRAHERMVRFGDLVYIRNNLDELLAFHVGHWSSSSAVSYHQLAKRWLGGLATPPQAQIFGLPRPPEGLYDLSTDVLQVYNRVAEPAYAPQLDLLRSALDQWSSDTGDTLPALVDMTPDRVNRASWEVVHPSGHPPGGEVPGEATSAHLINRPGPILLGDIENRR